MDLNYSLVEPIFYIKTNFVYIIALWLYFLSWYLLVGRMKEYLIWSQGSTSSAGLGDVRGVRWGVASRTPSDQQGNFNHTCSNETESGLWGRGQQRIITPLTEGFGVKTPQINSILSIMTSSSASPPPRKKNHSFPVHEEKSATLSSQRDPRTDAQKHV